MEIILRCKIIQEKKLCIIPAHDHDNKYKFKKEKIATLKRVKNQNQNAFNLLKVNSSEQKTQSNLWEFFSKREFKTSEYFFVLLYIFAFIEQVELLLLQ